MKRMLTTLLITGIVSCLSIAYSQLSIGQVLQEVETNNKELQAVARHLTVLKLEAKADNNLPDPTLSYTHQYGNRAGMGIGGKLIASQSFDFQTVYVPTGQTRPSQVPCL
ncbi:hypothetical protein Barb6_03754 [Bacteroidales bacterium Barb6]|nr:hypothetical protein Barb6_03754 [Bacteroidales bacterium Barb6]